VCTFITWVRCRQAKWECFHFRQKETDMSLFSITFKYLFLYSMCKKNLFSKLFLRASHCRTKVCLPGIHSQIVAISVVVVAAACRLKSLSICVINLSHARSIVTPWLLSRSRFTSFPPSLFLLPSSSGWLSRARFGRKYDEIFKKFKEILIAWCQSTSGMTSFEIFKLIYVVKFRCCWKTSFFMQ
jgi:hypothetical protein